MAKATIRELVELIGRSVMAACEVAGDNVYDLHIFLQAQRQGYTVHADYQDGAEAELKALRAELPADVFDLAYDENAYSDASEAFADALEWNGIGGRASGLA